MSIMILIIIFFSFSMHKSNSIGEPAHWIDFYKRGTNGLVEEWSLFPGFQRNADIIMQENGILTEKEILEIKTK